MKNKTIWHLLIISGLIILGVITYYTRYPYSLKNKGQVTLVVKGKTLLVHGKNVRTHFNGDYYILHDSIELDKNQITTFYSDAIYENQYSKMTAINSRSFDDDFDDDDEETGDNNEEDEESNDPYHVLFYNRFIKDKEVIDLDKWVIDSIGQKFEGLFE